MKAFLLAAIAAAAVIGYAAFIKSTLPGADIMKTVVFEKYQDRIPAEE